MQQKQQPQNFDDLLISLKILNIKGIKLSSKIRYFKLTNVHEYLFLFSSKKTCFLRSFLAFWQGNRNTIILFPMLIYRDKDWLCLWGVWYLMNLLEKNIHWVNRQIILNALPMCCIFNKSKPLFIQLLINLYT